MPRLQVAPATPGSNPNQNGLSDLAMVCQNLLSGAAALTSVAGVQTLVLKSGDIAQAASFEVGNGETADEVAANLAELQTIANYCVAHGIRVQVEANLTNAATWSSGPDMGHNALVDQWAGVAAQVGLPIASVEDVQEVATVHSPTDFLNYASIEANAVRTLIEDYAGSVYSLTTGNLAIGDMEGVSAATSAWWSAFKVAASLQGVPAFSFVTMDTGWFAPWIASMSQPAWQQCVSQMSVAAAESSMFLNMLVQGAATDPTAAQFARQAEQNAADLALLQSKGSVQVGSITVESWNAQPVSVGMLTAAGSPVNEAAEINAFYPLYAAGSITASGTISLSAPGQIVLGVGTSAPIKSLAVQWTVADVDDNDRIAVIVIDQTGTLTAAQHGTGTVIYSAYNILVLNGDAADIAAELASVRIEEDVAGADTVDIETFGLQGQLTDTQISVFAAAPGQTVSSIAAVSSAQGWIECSAILNTGTVLSAGSIMTSETLAWSTPAANDGTIAASTLSGAPAFLNVVSIHEPLAEYGVENAGSILLGTTTYAVADIFDPSVDWGAFPSNGYANNPGVNEVVSPQTTGWLPSSFNAAAALTPLIVRSTVRTFDPSSGVLQSAVAKLAPDPLTVTDLTGTHPNDFATAFNLGGTQVTEYNTGNNPAWTLGWGDQFNSATLTYDDTGRLVELFLQGGSAEPCFSLDYVFSPDTGRLWEVFQTTAPPPVAADRVNYVATSNPYQPGYVTGPMYETQFNTGDNPNWDYLDWGGSLAANTETWTDYFIMADQAGFAVHTLADDAGDLNNYACQFVNDSALDLMYLPGVNSVNLNNLGTVVIDSQSLASSLTGLDTIDAAGATGTVTIVGLVTGNCTLIGGDDCSTISGYGHDTIIAGAGSTEISTGTGNSTIEITSAGGTLSIRGDNNNIATVQGSTLTVAGTGNTLNGAAANVMMVSAGATLIVNGPGTGETIVMNGKNTLTLGTPEAFTGTIHAVTGDTLVLAGITATSATLSAGTLVVSDNTQIVASLRLTGDFASDQFAVDGSMVEIGERSSGGGRTLAGAVVLHGLSSQYVIADDAGSLYVQDTVSGRDGIQNLSGVTELMFSDGMGLFDPTGAAEAVARLYTAVLGRTPDVAGLTYWAAQMDDAYVPLASIANSFAASPEFMQDYGTLSDGGFVDQLYRNVLGRPADTGGMQYWNNQLAGGLSRGAMAQAVAESAEYIADTASMAGDGNTAEAYRLYVAALNRTPDKAGLAFWSGQLNEGAIPAQVAQAFIDSAEFRQAYGSLNASDFVSMLYENVLHRAPDAAGSQYWATQLQAGSSAAGVLLGFSDSLENRIQTATVTHANWVSIPNPP